MPEYQPVLVAHQARVSSAAGIFDELTLCLDIIGPVEQSSFLTGFRALFAIGRCRPQPQLGRVGLGGDVP